jgi:hypothetical protein
MPRNAAESCGQRAVKRSRGHPAYLAKRPLICNNPSGRPDLNLRPLDPQVIELAGIAAQGVFFVQASRSLTCGLFVSCIACGPQVAPRVPGRVSSRLTLKCQQPSRRSSSCKPVAGQSVEVIRAGQSVDPRPSRASEAYAVAAVCCCHLRPTDRSLILRLGEGPTRVEALAMGWVPLPEGGKLMSSLIRMPGESWQDFKRRLAKSEGHNPDSVGPATNGPPFPGETEAAWRERLASHDRFAVPVRLPKTDDDDTADDC